MKRVLVLMAILLFTLVGCSNEQVTEYRSDLQNVTEDMMNNSASAEELLNQYATVWSYSIESRGYIKVEDMAKGTGLSDHTVHKYFTDSDSEIVNLGSRVTGGWQDHIQSLQNYFSDNSSLNEIEELSGEIKSKIKELNEPPEGYEKVYDEVVDLYTLTEEYIQMAISPTGSLVSFNDDRRQLSDDIVSKYKKIEAILPSEEN